MALDRMLSLRLLALIGIMVFCAGCGGSSGSGGRSGDGGLSGGNQSPSAVISAPSVTGMTDPFALHTYERLYGHGPMAEVYA